MEENQKTEKTAIKKLTKAEKRQANKEAHRKANELLKLQSKRIKAEKLKKPKNQGELSQYYRNILTKEITEEDVNSVCKILDLYMFNNKSLKDTIEQSKIIGLTKFYITVNCSNDLQKLVAHARELRQENKLDEIIQIGDDSNRTPEDRKVSIMAREKYLQMSSPRYRMNSTNIQVNTTTQQPQINIQLPELSESMAIDDKEEAIIDNNYHNDTNN
jgi:hypothetical protein